MFRKKRRLNSNDESGDMALQITSMADIFTIILVFLLKSFSTGIANISPSKGVQLPKISSPSKESIKDALKVEISKNAIMVDQKFIVSLYNFRLKTELLPDGTENPVSEPVLKALLLERTKQKQQASAQSQLLLLADAKTPYRTLKTVLTSVANAGYVDLQLIVVGGE